MISTAGQLRVFVSSPSDTMTERDIVDRVINRINLGPRTRETPELVLIRWESGFYVAQNSFQTPAIGPSECDLVIAIFRSRLGLELPENFPRTKNGERYPSGPAYEVMTAIEAYQARGAPDVIVFRHSAPTVIATDDHNSTDVMQQWERLNSFFASLIQTPGGQFKIAYQTFNSIEDFEVKVEASLRQWLQRKAVPPFTEWQFAQLAFPTGTEAAAGDDIETILVENLTRSRPLIVDLAALASLAVHVEPFLLRRLRLRFLPASDASLEADLAFSELAISHAGSFELDPTFLPALRAHLSQKDWVDQAREVIANSHTNLSIALQTEEEVIYLALRKPAGWVSRISELLARAAKAANDRPEVAQWAFRAIQELPKEVQITDGFWLLAQTSGTKMGRAPPAGPIPATTFLNLASILNTVGPRTIDIGAARDQDDLLLTIPPTQAEFIFQAPETFPVALIIQAQENTERLKLDTAAGSAFAKVSDIGLGPITIRTIDDKVYAVPQSAAATPTKAPIFDNDRDRHLFGPGPKWILSLDGGGVRTVLTIAFLERLEQILSEREGKAIRLGDYFDLIGGTSTGAIIAGALALGFRTSEIKDFYFHLVPLVFKRSIWRLALLQPNFDSSDLRAHIEQVVGRRLLSSPDLITGFCLVAKRMDTGKPWIVTNNSRAPNWNRGGALVERTVESRGISQLPLASLIRASASTPYYFDPEMIELAEDAPAIPVIDGGATPYNNPALALFEVVTAKAQSLHWRTGPGNLGLISIGAGTFRSALSYEDLGFSRSARFASRSLRSMVRDFETLVLTQMQYMGESLNPWFINSEIGTLSDSSPPGGKMFRFLRCDVRLERPWLERELNYDVDDAMAVRLRAMDDPGMISELYRIGGIAAAKQLKVEHFERNDNPIAAVGSRF